MGRHAALAGLLLLGACSQAPEGQGQGAPPVRVSPPVQKEVIDWDEYSGQFEAVESVEVRARVSGYLDAVAFREGAIVKKGDLLARIDPRPFEAALASARADVESAVTRRDQTQADLGRGQVLVKEEAISREDFDARVQARREAESRLAAARARLRAAELDLGYTEVRSPISGRVGARLVTVGNLVSGGGPTSTLLTTVYSIDPIYFGFTADEAAYLKYVRQNAEGERPSSRDAANPVKLRLQDEQGFVHDGRMNFVDNRIDPTTGTMRGRAVFRNSDGLFLPGMFGRLQLLGSGRYRALLVPEAAILSDQSNKIVLVVGKDNVVQPRPVTLGALQPDNMRVIRSGIGPADQVIVGGIVRARPGSKVTPQPAGAGAGK
ncbi:efflux RND transporter periplasmic adaptor subunit [Sandarakinorhabdus oryzae]|uniref:efflux RND transporter periplasmic adaptor subunit n=1 Tax=Sandarakinorhabdus oryzae TaxID=2675220 RepID=UPI0012E24A0D|nr:efflux RND transporter periplasmic adaptor subunit [Sandarakinorhabdus oryzae]